MAFVERLVCSKCGREYEAQSGILMCEAKDYGRLDVVYDYEKVADAFSLGEAADKTLAEKYWPLLPVDTKYVPAMGEGGTPLLRAERLGEILGMKQLYFKDETRNPTGSFKDRAMCIGVGKALELGYRVTVTASSGNAAASLAAYSARAGLGCVAFVLEAASMEKLAQLAAYGAELVRLKGIEKGVDPTVRAMLRFAEVMRWYPCPSFGPFNPYQVEGLKTIYYELFEQLGYDPDWVFVPTGSGCLLTGVFKGFRDLEVLGKSTSVPKFACVQPEGNGPLVEAFKSGVAFDEVRPWPNPKSVASGLLDPYPWDGDGVLEALRRTGGTAIAVSDDEIMRAVRLLASCEGIFAEPSGAAGLAGLIKVLELGLIERDVTVVVLVTGSGLKDVSPLVKGLSLPVFEPDDPALVTYLQSLRAASASRKVSTELQRTASSRCVNFAQG